MRPRKKATFNLREDIHQGLKLAAAVQNREMTDIVEEALALYFKWTVLTGPELDELGIYETAEYDGPGKSTVIQFLPLCGQLEGAPANHQRVASTLIHLDAERLLTLELNGETGYQHISSFGSGTDPLYRGNPALRLTLSFTGRIRFQQLKARRAWERQAFATAQ
jgi:hypothetical protein